LTRDCPTPTLPTREAFMNDKSFAAAGAALFLAATGSLYAAEPPAPAPAACTMAVQRQFDFWIGEWVVTENGKVAGHSRIERILGGCALLENWSGAAGGAGKSLNFHDREDGKWHQTWIDVRGGALFLSGAFADGSMRLEGERRATDQEPATRHRITWTRLPDGKVRQVWESTAAGAQAWKVLFDGLYAPAPASR
jgi:hypothetical protein